jgi:NAD(P)-dependent dehydrogenase (short-subunit alcohol dehydrogenase family)/alkylhydroperoxidase family enzyme
VSEHIGAAAVRLPGVAPADWSDGIHALLDDALQRVSGIVHAGSEAGDGAHGDSDSESDSESGDDSNPLPTLTLIAHREQFLEPFLVWARALALEGALGPRRAELVALRTVWNCASVFEWREHRQYGLAAGMTTHELEAIATGPTDPTWDDLERALLRAADELHAQATITAGTWAVLERHLPPAEIVEVILLAGQYRMLSTLSNAAGVDHGLAGDRMLPRSWPEATPFPIDADLLGLSGAVALVTGGAQSIGKGCALQLARAGCHVVIADIADGSAAVDEIRALGRDSFSHRADMRSKDEIQQLVDAVVERFGRLDVAINTVGSTKGPKPFLDISREDWDDVVTQNLTTTMLSTQVEALAMIKLGIPGRIVNIASLSGLVASPNAAGYGAANAGVVHVTRSAAAELARYGIRVNCIVPGTHVTEAVQEAVSRDPQIAEWIRRVGDAAPLGRNGEVWETAGVAVFLASKLSSFVTGQDIVSDGGVLHTTSRPPMGMDAEAEAVLGLAAE